MENLKNRGNSYFSKIQAGIIEENYAVEELLEIVERLENCVNCRKSIWIGDREECIFVFEGYYCKNCWKDSYADYIGAWDDEEARI